MKKMIVAVEGSPFEPLWWPKGVANYLRHILQELAQQDVCDFYIFGKSFSPDVAQIIQDNISIHTIKAQSFIWRNTGIKNVCNEYGTQLAWFPFHVIPWLPAQIPIVSTVHDLSFITHLKSTNLKTSIYFTFGLINALLRSKRVVTISKATYQDITRYFPWSKHKLLIAPHGIPNDCLKISQDSYPSIISGESSPKKKRVLFLDAANARKDFETALLACNYLYSSGMDISLEATGNVELIKNRAIKILGRLPSFLILPGFISRNNLLETIHNSRVLAYLSHGEGFGFPILESMSLGCPVVCYDSAAEQEVAGAFGFYAKHNDIESVAKAIEKGLNASISQRSVAREYAVSFTWQKSAQIHLNAFRASLE